MHYLLIIFKLGNSCIVTAIHDKTKERNVKKIYFQNIVAIFTMHNMQGCLQSCKLIIIRFFVKL